MAGKYYNPFQGIDVNVPTEFHDDIARYTQREARAVIDESPFPRMVDMWFLAVCVAARAGLEAADVAKYETKKIIEGSIFSNDAMRVQMLMLIAIAYSDSVEIVAEPRKMMAIANGLAIAGLPKIVEMIKHGDGDPIWNLSDSIEGLVKTRRAA